MFDISKELLKKVETNQDTANNLISNKHLIKKQSNLWEVFNYKILKKYYQILKNSIWTLEFDDVEKHILKDFKDFKYLQIILNEIKKEAILISYIKSNKHEIYARISKVNFLIELFIGFIRFDPNLWFTISDSMREKSNFVMTSIISLPSMIIDYEITKNTIFDINLDQLKIIKNLESLNLDDDSEIVEQKLGIYTNNYLPLKMFCLNKEIIKVELKKSSLKEFNKLVLSTILQMIVIFIKINLDKYL
ncbi:hypothetical protein SHELI_v1c03040 [Spiroplasma helicoides]|uniref:Uncharacterized protein n=1 Tax=Spiroplasma helicoides TaxID=216938 RepID=A0A1B3SJZ8_9MOLU|nr:hypothetical protein [Spiroplasma helicoides]AOG60259.1 hypothetical protein SHELI_v1c03040 [Spiroplasma helicoides]